MHCGSVRQVGSVSCVQKLRKVQLFQGATVATDPSPNQIALCKYIPCDATWTLPNENHLCGTTRESTWICQNTSQPAGDLKMDEKLIIAVGNRPILYDSTLYTYRDTNRRDLAWREVSLEVGEPGNIIFLFIFEIRIAKAIGCWLRLQRLLPHASDTPTLFRRRTCTVGMRR